MLTFHSTGGGEDWAAAPAAGGGEWGAADPKAEQW
jgi:hypothetical protein